MKSISMHYINIVKTLLMVIGLLLLITVLSGKLVRDTRSDSGVMAVKNDAKLDPQRHASRAKKAEIKVRFDQGVVMLSHKEYDYALKSFHRVLELAPRMPEVHVNMGYAFLGGGDSKAARDFFMSAIELKNDQLNAYYGLAIASEKLKDIEMAIGAMRTYIHLSPKDDPFLPKARSALWEWQEVRKTQAETLQQKAQIAK